ncbi:hypothetical protein L873DRAFT_1786820 [Choiromyces venosus 120613-1]|uniref:Integrase core domain-containing protein n=1 Tax=Choiromyces venosus 120613-1 TaxID=1336337 RepID=A0A3N4JZP7_9PEZI|nr:hypothetical protein L873DRAFT_1786820 [Choiromyces venosus 120613-1]
MGTAPTPEAQLEAAQKAEIYVQEHLISGEAIRYGRQYTLSNIRLSGIFVSQKQVQEAMKVVDPEGVASRAEAFGTQRKRKEFTVKGLNRVLSIDGHDKLSRFGFEIYGAIDAYSRYIAWCYVEISNRTAVLIQSDKGTEMVLLAASHVTLRCANHPSLKFSEIYCFGKSIKNQHIEAWWNLLTEGQTQEWKVYFAELENEGLFVGSDLDKSCLQFIYMEIIRSHIHRFIEIHNNHLIWHQRKRDHYLPTR